MPIMPVTRGSVPDSAPAPMTVSATGASTRWAKAEKISCARERTTPPPQMMKGFSDCLCTVTDEGVTVIVPKEQLNDTAALVIDDAVTSHYSVDYEKISIVGAE